MPQPSTDAEAWRTCYRELAPRLLLFARQWLASKADAEDVVQSAFVRFWRKYPDAQADQYPLLYAAVRTASLDLLRSRNRRERRELEYHGDSVNGEEALFAPAVGADADSQLLEQALQRLPEEQREVLVLRIWGDLTFAQIATALDASINTVSSRYRYGIEALRKFLKPHAHELV